MARHAYRNSPSNTDVPKGAPIDQVKIDFANRLQKAMVAKGYNQSELARRTADYMPEDPETGKRKRFGRDNISTYIRGLALPQPATLAALAKAVAWAAEGGRQGATLRRTGCRRQQRTPEDQ